MKENSKNAIRYNDTVLSAMQISILNEEWREQVKKRMEQMNIKHESLASELGVTRGLIGHYVHNRRTPQLSMLKKLAGILSVEFIIKGS